MPRSVGLVSVTPGEGGYTRRRAGKGFTYQGANGRRITDEKILERIRDGNGTAQDLDTLLAIADGMTGKTICVLSDSCATPVVSGLKKFRHEFEAKLKQSPNVVSFAAAMGACVACTALPVLAAILREAGWTGTRLRQTALALVALAALNDMALWLLVAVVLALASGSGAGALAILAFSAAWAAAMALLVRPLLERLGRVFKARV